MSPYESSLGLPVNDQFYFPHGTSYLFTATLCRGSRCVSRPSFYRTRCSPHRTGRPSPTFRKYSEAGVLEPSLPGDGRC